jgi:hypothetical protein
VEVRRCFRVFALNASGESPASSVACTAAPATATDLTAQTLATGIDISWRDNSGVEDGYWVLRSTEPDEYGNDYWELIGQVGVNVTTFHDTITSAILGYALYSVQPFKDSGLGDSSEPVGVALPQPVVAGTMSTVRRVPIPHGKKPRLLPNHPGGGQRAPRPGRR